MSSFESNGGSRHILHSENGIALRNLRGTPQPEKIEAAVLDRLEETFEREGVTHIMKNIATILQGETTHDREHQESRHPTLEIVANEQGKRMVLRSHPTHVRIETLISTPDSELPVISRGVAVDDEGTVFYMARGEGIGRKRTSGGWRNLHENPHYQLYEELRGGSVDLSDQINYALSISESSFDHRRGADMGHLSGKTEGHGISRKLL
jgi:hypothetical protein